MVTLIELNITVCILGAVVVAAVADLCGLVTFVVVPITMIQLKTPLTNGILQLVMLFC